MMVRHGSHLLLALLLVHVVACSRRPAPDVRTEAPRRERAAPDAAAPGPSGSRRSPVAGETGLNATRAPGGAGGESSGEAADRLPTDRHGRPYPRKFACIVELLEYLASRSGDWREGFDLGATKKLDVGEILSRISPAGLTLKEDTPPGKELEVAPRTVEQQLSSRKGPSFLSLAHLGRMYADPYPQYSALSFQQPQPAVVVVEVGRGVYELTFDLASGSCHVRKIHYMLMEGD